MSHYPEYEQLVIVARSSSPFVDPAEIKTTQDLMSRRGGDWCTAVLGRSVIPSLMNVSLLEARILVAADAADITPDLPASIIEQRQQAEQWRLQTEKQYQQMYERDVAAWEQALAQCSIPVEVRANTQGRRYGTGLNMGPLRHVVALVPARSGRREHLQDRALCETASRHKERVLSSPTDEPATCKSCLKHATTAKAI